MASKKKEKLTVEKSMDDFKAAYRAKSKLVEREKDDFLFALGEQWSDKDKETLSKLNIKPYVDNRIQPNLFLLTGLERQNRTDFKAFPIGEEDGIKAEIASALFKDSIKKSDFQFKSSDQFKDGITCGESHLELYLDNTDSLLNGKPCWTKIDGGSIFPDPASREYDFSDAKYVYKIKLGIEKEDLINLYPESKSQIEEADGAKLDLAAFLSARGNHLQLKDYPKTGDVGAEDEDRCCFDLIERYYKKWVERVFVADKQTGEIKQSEDGDKADAFIAQYRQGIEADQQAYSQAIEQKVAEAHAMMGQAADGSLMPVMPMTPEMRSQHLDMLNQAGQLPPPPPQQDPERFILIKRQVPEIWCFAHLPGAAKPLADEPAWFYPKWKGYPFVPFFARFSTAPLTGDARHLLIQGLVYGVKGVQEKHNKAEMLMLRHLNTTANSGWLSEEDSWVDAGKVNDFGTSPGVNLEYKKGHQKPERITPVPLSNGHALISNESAEAIKAQLGINSDLLAVQQGGTDSGRAIALRQKQGLLMVQELFDNLSRTRQIAGRLLLSQFGEMYDTDTAMKVLGDAFLKKNFPPLLLMNPDTLQQEPMPDPKTGEPMLYDKDMAQLAIAEVLSGKLEEYDVSVGETVSSDTEKMAAAFDIKDLATTYPGIISPDILVKYSQIPESAKTEILASLQAQQQAAQAAAQGGMMPPQSENKK